MCCVVFVLCWVVLSWFITFGHGGTREACTAECSSDHNSAMYGAPVCVSFMCVFVVYPGTQSVGSPGMDRSTRLLCVSLFQGSDRVIPAMCMVRFWQQLCKRCVGRGVCQFFSSSKPPCPPPSLLNNAELHCHSSWAFDRAESVGMHLSRSPRTSPNPLHHHHHHPLHCCLVFVSPTSHTPLVCLFWQKHMPTHNVKPWWWTSGVDHVAEAEAKGLPPPPGRRMDWEAPKSAKVASW